MIMIHVQIACDCLGSLDILALCRLITATEKDNHDITAMNEIDALTWALIDTKLANPVEKLCISEKASL
jgi:hypothetical protein